MQAKARDQLFEVAESTRVVKGCGVKKDELTVYKKKNLRKVAMNLGQTCGVLSHSYTADTNSVENTWSKQTRHQTFVF